MNQKKSQSSAYAIASCMIAGMALHISGVQYILLSVLAMYLLLGAMGRPAGYELLLVASVFGGKALCAILHLLILDQTNSSLNHFLLILESISVAIIAIVLLITQKRAVAWCLIVYSTFMEVLIFWVMFVHVPNASRSRLAFSQAIIYGLMVWLLFRWLQYNELDTSP